MVDVWDNRLRHEKPVIYTFTFPHYKRSPAVYLEAEVSYGLLHESRRRRIGYENREPVTYTIYSKRIKLD